MAETVNEIRIPDVDPLYVMTPISKIIEKVATSDSFFPIMVSGPTGVGKTYGIIQTCARSKRPMLRTNITIETDEDSLIGGFRLKDGATYFSYGPVIQAMKEGCVLLLDEIDLANPMKVMCLQSILEGEPYHIKKTGEIVYPAKGFQIIATGNTKGIGDDSGMYVGTQILNEAFMERFGIVLEQTFPTVKQETNILTNICDSLGITDYVDDVSVLINWANHTREAALNTDNPYFISTRRLIFMLKAYKMFKDIDESVKMCLSRFDKATADALWDMYILIKNPEGKESVDKDEYDLKNVDFSNLREIKY